MKWSRSIALSLTIIFSNLCLSSTSPLTIWTSSENVKTAIDSVVPAFEKEFKTKVNVVVLNKDLTTQFKTASLSKKGPDILCWAHDVIGELAESGFIEPIVIPAELKNEFVKVSLDAFSYKGNLYGYPYDIESIALIYNTDLVKELPKSFEEVLLMAHKLNKPSRNQYGFLYDINNFFFSYPFINAKGGYIFGSIDGFINVNDVGLGHPGAVKGLHLLKSFIDSGLMSSSVDRSIAFNKMLKGELAFTIDGPWAVNELVKSGVHFSVSPIPNWEGFTPKPFVGAHGFIIRRSSPNKELAKELIEKFLVTKKGILTLYKHDPRGPSRHDAIEYLGGSSNHLKSFMESAKKGIPMPNVPEMGMVWQAMGAAFNLTLNGQITPEKALNDAKNQVEISTSK